MSKHRRIQYQYRTLASLNKYSKEPILILLLCLAVTLPVAWLLKRFQTYLDAKIFSSKVHNTHL